MIQATHRLIRLAIVLFLTMLLPPASVQSAVNDGEKFVLELKDADIASLIETVSHRTGRNFIIDPRVKARVTVISSSPVNNDELYELFLSVLAVHGYAAVSSGSYIKIIPAATGITSAVPVIDGQDLLSDELVTQVITLDSVPAQQLVPMLRPLLSDVATIGAELNSNTVVITDRASNVARIEKIIRALMVAN